MSKKRVDFVFPQKVFQLKAPLRYEIWHVGEENHKIIVVDGFYKNPELVRDLFLRSPVPVWKMQDQTRNFKDYYDCRHVIPLPYGFSHVVDTLTYLVKKEFKHIVEFPNEAVTNVFQLIKDQPLNTSAYPHVDASPIKSQDQPVNALIYLNTNAEARGGTAFFRHLKTGRESIPMTSGSAYNRFHNRYIENDRQTEDGSTYWCAYQNHWEKFFVVPMKFNRLVIFPSKIFHAAWHEPNWFKTYPRINQVFFSEHAESKTR